jgi:5-oxoprolinase (ATP-hydrolysing)
VTIDGARKNYGVVVDSSDFSVKNDETEMLRAQMAKERADVSALAYNGGGDLKTLQEKCLEETGLPPPKRQWETDPYGPHTGLKYVQEWYKEMREKGDAGWKGLHWAV